MRLNYLPQPGMSSKAGLGLGFAKFGESIAKIGDIGYDEKKRRRDESVEDMKLGFAKGANTRAEESHALSKEQVQKNIETLDFNLKTMQDKKADKETKKKATVSVFRTLHPNATKNFNDEEVEVFAAEIDKFLPKNEKITKLDTRVTPKGNKILTYESGGKIYERNMGKVKTDWNPKKSSSDIPEGHVSVGKEFYEDYADKGMVKISKDGRFYAPIDFVNQKGQEYIEAQHDVGNLKLE